MEKIIYIHIYLYIERVTFIHKYIYVVRYLQINIYFNYQSNNMN